MVDIKSTRHLHCDDDFRQKVADNLARFTVKAHAINGVKQAAVALTIVDAGHGADVFDMPVHEQPNHEAALVLTRRSARLRHHSGQWAFPGGRLEKGETPEGAALRELHEEVDLELSSDRILGRLDDFTTRSGFVITPVVVWAGPGAQLTPNPGEVQSIHRIPMTEFLREDAPILEKNPNGINPILLMPVGDSWIAAPTAALIYQFREIAILGKDTRVAHYEQPFFAWK